MIQEASENKVKICERFPSSELINPKLYFPSTGVFTFLAIRKLSFLSAVSYKDACFSCTLSVKRPSFFDIVIQLFVRSFIRRSSFIFQLVLKDCIGFTSLDLTGHQQMSLIIHPLFIS